MSRSISAASWSANAASDSTDAARRAISPSEVITRFTRSVEGRDGAPDPFDPAVEIDHLLRVARVLSKQLARTRLDPARADAATLVDTMISLADKAIADPRRSSGLCRINLRALANDDVRPRFTCTLHDVDGEVPVHAILDALIDVLNRLIATGALDPQVALQIAEGLPLLEHGGEGTSGIESVAAAR